MGFEDEKAKLRRNLVVFCFILLSSAYLDFSVTDLLAEMNLKKSDLALSAHKFVILSALVFIYLTWRWFTCDEQVKQFRAMQKDVTVKSYSLLQNWVISRILSERFDDSVNFANEAEGKGFLHWKEILKRTDDPEGKFRLSYHGYQGKHTYKSMWEFNILPAIKATSDGRLVKFKINAPFLIMAKIVARTTLHLFGRESFWEWAPPVFLALPTAVLIIYRFFW